MQPPELMASAAVAPASKGVLTEIFWTDTDS